MGTVEYVCEVKGKGNRRGEGEKGGKKVACQWNRTRKPQIKQQTPLKTEASELRFIAYDLLTFCICTDDMSTCV